MAEKRGNLCDFVKIYGFSLKNRSNSVKKMHENQNFCLRTKPNSKMVHKTIFEFFLKYFSKMPFSNMKNSQNFQINPKTKHLIPNSNNFIVFSAKTSKD